MRFEKRFKFYLTLQRVKVKFHNFVKFCELLAEKINKEFQIST